MKGQRYVMNNCSPIKKARGNVQENDASTRLEKTNFTFFNLTE